MSDIIFMTSPDQTPQQLRANRGFISSWIGLTVLRVLGWRIEGKIPDVKRFILIGAPHTSNWDFVLAMASILTIDLKMRWLMKHTAFKPYISWLFHWLGGIPTNRKEPKVIVRNVERIANEEEGIVIGITPEGTRKKVEKWKTGFLRLAMNLECPILMVGLMYPTKRVFLGELFHPTGDNEADLAAIRAYYNQFQGKYPDQF